MEMMRHKLGYLAAGVCLLLLAACGGGTTPTSAGSIPKTRAGLIAAFPASVRPLLTSDIPTPVIAALLQVRRSGPGTLVDWDSGGQLFQGEQIAYINNWQKITGWTVKDVAPSPSPGQVQAQVATGHPNFDMYETGSNGDAMVAQKKGLIEPLNMSLLHDDLAMLPKGWQYTPYWIQYSYFQVLLLWNTHVWPRTGGKHPTTALDLFNTKEFPGKRCLFKYPEYAGTLEYPLLASGVSPSHLYPLDVSKALAKLDTIKSDIVWWTTGAQSVSDIANGTCAMGTTWQGRPALALKSNPGLPLGWTWNQTLLIDSGWAIPKGAAHAAAAQSLIAFDFTPLNQCRFINALGYGVPMRTSCLNSFGKEWGITPQHEAESIAHQSPAYYSTHEASLVNQFNAWLTS